MDDLWEVNGDDELIYAHVPEAEYLTREEALSLAKQRDEEAADQLEEDYFESTD